MKSAAEHGANIVTAPNTLQPSGRLTAGISLTLALVTFLLFLPARHHDFLNWDDMTYVVDNDHVKGGVTWDGTVWAFTSSHSANWHPLTWLSHALDCQLYGLQSGGHHLTNVLFHAANAALLFLLLHGLTGAHWRSALIAAIFAWHPLRVESVAWLSERKDVLATSFGLLSLLAYGRFARTRLSPAPGKTNWRVWYGLTFAFLAFGLMSKPMLVTWPFVMLLLDFWPLQRLASATRILKGSNWKRLVFEKLPFFALVLASCIATVLAQSRGGAVASFEHLPLGLRLQNALVAYVEYLAKLFWPSNLSPIYPHAAQLEGWRVTAALGLLLALTGAAWIARRRFPYAIVGWLWFLGTLVPVIGILQVGSQALADRYTYIPMIGVVLALVGLGHELLTRLRTPRIVVALGATAILVILGWRTTVQLAYWQNTETLFRHTLKHSPNNIAALYGLGSYLVDHGQIPEGKQLLEQVIELQPSYTEALGTLAVALEGEGQFASAVRYYEAALKAQPDHPGVLNNFAWLRAAGPDASLRDGDQAVHLATQACELTGWTKPLFLGTLAAAQAEAGDFPSAIATAERATALATALRLEDTARRNRELIQLYRQGKAAHGGPPKVR